VAIAEGTHMELRENNLLAERHIRYGGIAYPLIDLTHQIYAMDDRSVRDIQ
jgi:hypothetical protein